MGRVLGGLHPFGSTEVGNRAISCPGPHICASHRIIPKTDGSHFPHTHKQKPRLLAKHQQKI